MGAYFFSYLNTAQSILSLYKFEQPFHVHLKSFFKRNKKYGSRDRKIISNLCYGFFRIGDAANELDFNDQVIIGYFLSHEFDNGFLALLKPEWKDKIQFPIIEKLAIVKDFFPAFNPNQLFPGLEYLSSDILVEELSIHHFHQPDFFIRVRPKHKKNVVSKLKQNEILFKEIGSSALRIASGIDIQNIIDIDREAVVQDISSQATFGFLPVFSNTEINIWDACAGSGGKSIMAVDAYDHVNLYVSDIREDILEELKRRFHNASINPTATFCTDLQHSLSRQVVAAHLPAVGVDLVIADVPCTGSGTWGRNPEWLKGFDVSLIDAYHERQVNIVSNLLPHIKNGGYLLYITCSVFIQENEKVASYLESVSALSLIKKGIINQQGGDYLFAALFKKGD